MVSETLSLQTSACWRSPMPTPLQYPLERCRALQEKWLRLPHQLPPQEPDDDDDDEDEDEEEDAAAREPFG
jgi:hypothetical protein